MTLVTRQSMIDDDGTFTFGTVVTKAFVDQVYDQIDDQAHSSVNPTIKPKAITDEVVAARGSKASVDARLDVFLNEDGTPKPIAGLVTAAQVGSVLSAGRPTIRNQDLQSWPNGDAADPGGWVTTNATPARCGPGKADTTQLGAGVWTCKLTWTAGTGEARASIIPSSVFARFALLKTQKVQFGCYIKTSIASHVRLKADDGAVITAGTYHTGDGTTQWLTVTHTVSNSATKIDVVVEIASAGSGYFEGPNVTFGELGATFWPPDIQQAADEFLDGILRGGYGGAYDVDVQNIGGTKQFYFPPRFQPGNSARAAVYDAIVSGRVSTQTNQVGNIGGGTDDLHSFTVPADYLNVDGKALLVRCWGSFGANANVKTVSFVFGATTIQLHSAATNGGAWYAEIEIVRTGAATQKMVGRLGNDTGTGQRITLGNPTETLSGAVVLKTTCNSGGSATDDIVEQAMIVEVIG